MTETMTREEEKEWHWIWAWALGLLVLLTLAIRYTEPVRDGDLWWQMAYGRYLVEHRTLVTDHTAFSWTPAQNSTIYCAWLAEIFLYLFHTAGGLPVLFAFRYACLLLFVLAVWYQASRLGVVRHPLTWLICLLGVLMSQNAAYIKPEIFSYVFMTLTVLVWLRIKSDGEKAWRTCYLFPVLMLLWVNSHGGFIFGAAFLFVMGIGEGLNILLSPEEALPSRVRRHFVFALFLSSMTLFVTPYGWRYPGYLLSSLLSTSEEYFKAIEAYLSVLDPRVSHFHYTSYLALAASILLVLMAPKVKHLRPDWAILLTNLAFALLFTRFLRTTYYWAPVFSLSAVHLLAGRVPWLWPKRQALALGLGSAIALASVLLGARAGFDAVCKPYGPRWFGFGVSYQNPVEEADFIRDHLSTHRLGNDYTSGGYLLWALWPDTKVMIDPRQFPFRAWLDRYGAFHAARDVRGFLRDFPFEVCCVRHECRGLVTWFLRAPDWKIAFYGASAAVFARRDIPLPAEVPRAGQGIEGIKNITQALFVFDFAARIGDWGSARKVVADMKERFKCPNHRDKVRDVSDWLDKRLDSLRREGAERGRAG
jgi:hypothetical protein